MVIVVAFGIQSLEKKNCTVQFVCHIYGLRFIDFVFPCAGFLRKVYGILTAQLSLTVIVAAIFMYTEGIKSFVQSR